MPDAARGVAVVTGGSRGIGAATAIRLARDGWAVCIGYRSAADEAARVVERCQAAGADDGGSPAGGAAGALAVAGDIADPDHVAALFAAADTLGPLTVLVNNAGIVGRPVRVDELDADRLERMFAVNAVAPFLCAGQAVRRMSTTAGGRGGAIVNVSSVASRLGSPNEYVDYAASKAAVDTLTIGLAREVAREGIRVNTVRPGLIETEIHARGGQPDRVERLRGAIPMGRPGQVDEVANLIAWLCSDEASYVTGSHFDVTGGR